jgi:hypothetical protein
MSHKHDELSAAWNAGGTKAVALLLSVDQRRAGSIISNMRRTAPDLFPRRAKTSRIQKQWRLREAIRLIEEGYPELALPYIKDCIKGPKNG